MSYIINKRHIEGVINGEDWDNLVSLVEDDIGVESPLASRANTNSFAEKQTFVGATEFQGEQTFVGECDYQSKQTFSGGIVQTISTKTADYTILLTDTFLVGNPSGTSTITFTLPNASTCSSQSFPIKNISTLGDILILPYSPDQLIEGQASLTLEPGDGVICISNGSQWFVF